MTLSFNTMRSPVQAPRVLIQPVDLAYAIGVSDHLVKTMKHLPESRRIARLHAEGKTLRTISKRMGISTRQVSRRLKNLSDYEKKYNELVAEYKPEPAQPSVTRYAPRLYFNACMRCGGTVQLDWDVLLHVNAMDCLSCGWNFHPTGLGLVRRDKLAVGT